jgi:G3E family GTPase
VTSPVLFACVGGFLGAGKTTALLAAAGELRARGLMPGLVANDQGHDLVDAEVFRRLGVPSGFVAGGCFCCRFDDLLAQADRLLTEHPVDVLLAEAVGSCTDLVATVYRPLRRFFPDRFRLGPLSVLVEPARLVELLDPRRPQLSDVAYLFDRQIREADLVLLTKTDLLTPAARLAARGSLDSLVREVPVHEVSASSGEGVGAWVDLLLGAAAPSDRALDVDYDRYARGEAALAWLNAAIEATASTAMDPRAFGDALIHEIARRSREAALFLPHAKALLATSEGSAWIALTRADGALGWTADRELPPEPQLSAILNVRAAADPDALRALVEQALIAAGHRLGASVEVRRLECFSPPRPVPRHRLASAVASTADA